MRLIACALLVSLAASVPAASVAEVLDMVDQNLKPDELQEPGSQARAKAIDGVMHEDLGLSPAEIVDLKLALAEAWLDALKPDECEKIIAESLGTAGLTAAQRDRAGLAWVASWQLRFTQAADPATMPSVLATIKPFGDLGARVAARAHSGEAQRLLAVKDKDHKVVAPDDALAQYDLALALLKDLPAEERVPVYHLRLLGMEEIGKKPDEVQAWLLERQGDPAAAEVAESALTSGQKLVGEAAPPLKLKRLDGQPGEVDLGAFKGKPVLIDFFATWCKPCVAAAPAIAAFAAKHASELATIGVSLDTKDTFDQIPAYIAANGVGYPVVGDALGWDSEVDDAWHVDKIPTLILVGANGRVAAVDLIGASDQETEKNLEDALAPLLAGQASPAAPAPAGRATHAAAPEPDAIP